MSKGKLFKYLAAASGYIGIGLLLGYMLSDKLNDNPLWFGGLLTLLGAILLGMAISSKDAKPSATATDTAAELRRASPTEPTSTTTSR